jgi:hypothetical protein
MKTATGKSARKYACSRCGRKDVADEMVYSPHTLARYCADIDACAKRVRRQRPVCDYHGRGCDGTCDLHLLDEYGAAL